MAVLQRLRAVGRACLPPSLAQPAKRVAVYARFRAKAAAARRAYRAYGDRYPQPILFAAGLPKSGTTWLVRLIASYPGFQDEVVIPEIARHELAEGGSHALDLPDDAFTRFRDMLVFMKMHVHASPHNLALLRDADVPYVIMYRDLRDVAVSHYFYVRRTPWHPEHRLYANLDVEAGLLAFADRLLPAYVDWVRGWHERRDPARGLEVRYERMLAEPLECTAQVARHYELDASPETIRRIVESQRFERVSGGRARGSEADNSHFRKGIAGDWRNHFTPAVTERFKRVCADFLIEYDYEADDAW